MLSQRLLEHIAICQDQKMQLTVSQAMELTFASPATLHRKLDMLIGAGLVDTQFKDGNHRTKHLILTPKAVKQFKQLGQILINSTRK
jgi:DNA-binding MarR family transcriptional regulator